MTGTTERLHSIDFVDNLHGWVVGSDGVILHTSNGGIDWSTFGQDPILYTSTQLILQMSLMAGE